MSDYSEQHSLPPWNEKAGPRQAADDGALIRPKTICLDFDGVIHEYSSGWKGSRIITDPPVNGAIDFLLGLIAEGYEPAIYSSRSHALGGRRAMKQWLVKKAAAHFRAGNDVASATRQGPLDSWFGAGYMPGMEPAEVEAVEAGCWLVRQIRWPKHKPPALLYIDDRGYRFEGEIPNVSALQQWLTPWNKK